MLPPLPPKPCFGDKKYGKRSFPQSALDGKAQAWLGGLLSFKPLISAKDGVLEPIGRVRTNDKGLDAIVNKIKEDLKRTW